MNDNISRESAFFQHAQNIKKNGAYYTDLDHARRIGYLFDFDSADEISVLEPSAGDGEALLAVTGKIEGERSHMKLFLVEINGETVEEKLEGREEFDFVLHADFLNGVKISNSRFTFSFANWPYGKSMDKGARLETKFLERETNYLSNGAYLAVVVPRACLEDDEFKRKLFANYEVCGLWRFDDNIFRMFNQMVVVGRRKPTAGYRQEVLAVFQRKLEDFSSIPYLPKSESEVKERFVVRRSAADDIVYFTKRVFDPADFRQYMSRSVLFTNARVTNDIFMAPYKSSRSLRPLLPLTKDMSYICAVQGEGEGLCGSVRDQDLHLQRGCVRISREVSVQGGENSRCVVERTRSRVQQTVVENSGKITQFG